MEESETLVLHARCSARHAAGPRQAQDQGLERAPRASHLGEKGKKFNSNRDFLQGPVAKTLCLPMQGAQVRSLVGELDSICLKGVCMPQLKVLHIPMKIKDLVCHN